jgi:formylglycine-generating enzyme required for sulfatase activity
VAESSGEGYRLPKEAEWEYACRAGSTTRYSFGDDAARLGEAAWYSDNSGGKTHPVGQKQPNAWGLYDMHGNVWEWCWDRFDANDNRPSPGADPLSTSQAALRVLRGGCWLDAPRHARSANRSGLSLRKAGYNLGFRVARVQSGP